MAVEVQRDPYLPVAQPFAGDLRMNAGREHVCRVGMSKIVEADAGQGGARDLPIPIVSEGVGLQRQAILTRANKSLIGEPNAEPQQLLSLPEPMVTAQAARMKHGANKADELVDGIGVIYHPVGNLPISNAMNAPSPDDQVRNHIRMLFEHGRTGKPHLLPQAEELLRQWKEHEAGGLNRVERPKPVLPASHAKAIPPVTENTKKDDAPLASFAQVQNRKSWRTKRHTSLNGNRMIHAGASEQAAHEAGVRAQEASVWGADCKKDRNGNYIAQGIGSWPNHVTPNHFNSVRRYEGEQKYQAAVRKLWKECPDRARKIGLPEPERISS